MLIRPVSRDMKHLRISQVKGAFGWFRLTTGNRAFVRFLKKVTSDSGYLGVWQVSKKATSDNGQPGVGPAQKQGSLPARPGIWASVRLSNSAV